MKRMIFITITAFILTSFTWQPVHIDPTGTYKLDGKTRKKDGETYGYFGEIAVKKLTDNEIVMEFFVCKGAPSYNSGSFVDTLKFENSRAIFTDPDADTTCKITFDFEINGVAVKEETANYNFGCGFGHAVVADGFYKKTSAVPTFTELLTGDQK